MSSASEDKAVSMYGEVETGRFTILYYSKNCYDFLKSSSETIILLLTAEHTTSFCKLT